MVLPATGGNGSFATISFLEMCDMSFAPGEKKNRLTVFNKSVTLAISLVYKFNIEVYWSVQIFSTLENGSNIFLN